MNKKRIITIVLIIVLIFACYFLYNLGRKVYIISKYSNKSKEYVNTTNFYKKTNQEDDVTTEFWRKDNIGLLKRTSKDDIKMIYYGTDYNWIFVENKDEKTAVKMIKEGAGIETQTLQTETFSMENLWDMIKMACISKISTETLNNVECYKINVNKEWQLFINKNSLLVIREINGSTDTGIIEYKINAVKDEDVSMPNLEGYIIDDTVNENRESEEKMNTTIKVNIDNKNYTAILEQNETTEQFLNMLPQEFNMSELNGNEKYVYLDTTLPSNSYSPKHIESGDIMLYGNNCLVVFYKSFDTSYSYTKIGHIDNLNDLGNKNVSIKFEK